MMLTIHGLPKYMKFIDVKRIITEQCRLEDFILDNLVPDGLSLKVRVGVADESEGITLLRGLDNFQIGQNTLSVKPIGKALDPNQPQIQNTYNNVPQNNYGQPQNNYMGQQAPPQPRPDPWAPSNNQSQSPWGQNQQVPPMHQNQYNPQNYQQPNAGFNNYQQQMAAPRNNSNSFMPPHQQPQQPDAFGQRNVFVDRAPQNQNQSFGYGQKSSPVPFKPVPPSTRPLLRSVDIVDAPIGRPTQRDAYQAPQDNKAITIAKDKFQGPSQYQFGEHQSTFRVETSGPWASPQRTDRPFGDKRPYQEQPSFGSQEREPAGLLRVPEGFPRRDPTAFQGRESPYNKDAAKNPRHGSAYGRDDSPVRRPNPFGKDYAAPPRDFRSDSRKDDRPFRRDGRSASPLKRGSPGRRFSPGRRASPDRRDRYSPSHCFEKRPEPFGGKQVRPAYESTPEQAPKQALYSAGYRPSVNENVGYPIPGQRSSWQDRDKYTQAKKPEDRKDFGRPFDSEAKPSRLSRSPLRRDHSPLRDKFSKLSPSPRRSPRRSWAVEKRRSPEIEDAPPPPSWPGQNSYKDDKRFPVWETKSKKDESRYDDDRRSPRTSDVWKPKDDKFRRSPNTSRREFKPPIDEFRLDDDYPKREERSYKKEHYRKEPPSLRRSPDEYRRQDDRSFKNDDKQQVIAPPPRSYLQPWIKETHDKAVEMLVERFMQKHDVSSPVVRNELRIALSLKIKNLCGRTDLSAHEILVRFNQRYSSADCADIYQEVLSSLPKSALVKKEEKPEASTSRELSNRPKTKEQLKEMYKRTVEEIRRRILIKQNFRPSSENFKRVCEELTMHLLKTLLKFGEKYGPSCDIQSRYELTYTAEDEDRMFADIVERVRNEGKRPAEDDPAPPSKFARTSDGDLKRSDARGNASTVRVPQANKDAAKTQKENPAPAVTADPVSQGEIKPIVNPSPVKKTPTKTAPAAKTTPIKNARPSETANTAPAVKVSPVNAALSVKSVTQINDVVAKADTNVEDNTVPKVIPEADSVADKTAPKETPVADRAAVTTVPEITSETEAEKVTTAENSPTKSEPNAETSPSEKPEENKDANEGEKPEKSKEAPSTKVEPEPLRRITTEYSKAIAEELEQLMLNIAKTPPEETSAEIDIVLETYNNQAADKLLSVLELNLKQRLLNMHNPLNMKVTLGRTLPASWLTPFVRKFNVRRIRRMSDDKTCFVAEMRSFKDFDKLFAANRTKLGGVKVVLSPLYHFDEVPEELQRLEKEEERAKYFGTAKKSRTKYHDVDRDYYSEDEEFIDDEETLDFARLMKEGMVMDDCIVVDECVGSDDE